MATQEDVAKRVHHNESTVKPSADSTKKNDKQVETQQQQKKGAADTFSEQAAKVQREGSTNRSVNDAIAKSHPQTARVENFSTKAENGQKMDVRVVPNAQTGQKDYFVAGKDGNYMPYKEVDGKLRPVDEGKKGDKAEKAPDVILPPQYSSRPEHAEPAKSTSSDTSNLNKGTQSLSRESIPDAARSPKSSDKLTIDSKQFSPVPQNDRSADQRGAEKSTNIESSRKGTEGGAPRSEGAGNDPTSKSATGPKVNSEAGASENRNRSVSPNEQSAAKSNLTELGVYKKFEGDKIDNRVGADKAAKPEQPPQSQEGRLRRDLMEQNNQGKDPGRRDVLDQNSSRGNSAEAKNTGIPIPARTAENAGGRGSGGAGGASNSSETNTGKPITKSTEGTKGGDGVGGGSSRRGDFDDRKSDGKNVRADGRTDKADEKNVKAEGKNDRPVRDAEGAKSQDSKPGDGKDGRSNSKGESDNRHDGGKNQDDRNESNKGKKQESKIEDRDSGKGNRPDRTEPIGAGRRDGKNNDNNSGGKAESKHDEVGSRKGDRADGKGPRGEKADADSVGSTAKSGKRPEGSIGSKGEEHRGDGSRSADGKTAADKSVTKFELKDLLVKIQNTPLSTRNLAADLVAKISKVPDARFNSKEQALADQLRGLNKSELNSIRNILTIGAKPQLSDLSPRLQERIGAILKSILHPEKDGMPKPESSHKDATIVRLGDRKVPAENLLSTATLTRLKIDQEQLSARRSVDANPNKQAIGAQKQDISAQKHDAVAHKQDISAQKHDAVAHKQDAVALKQDTNALKPHQILQDIMSRLQKDGIIKSALNLIERVEAQTQTKDTAASRAASGSRNDKAESSNVSSEKSNQLRQDYALSERSLNALTQQHKLESTLDSTLEKAATKQSKSPIDSSDDTVFSKDTGITNSGERVAEQDSTMANDELIQARKRVEISNELLREIQNKRQKTKLQTSRSHFVQAGETLLSIGKLYFGDANGEFGARAIFARNSFNIRLRKFEGQIFTCLEEKQLLAIPLPENIPQSLEETSNNEAIHFGGVPSLTVAEELSAFGEPLSENELQSILTSFSFSSKRLLSSKCLNEEGTVWINEYSLMENEEEGVGISLEILAGSNKMKVLEQYSIFGSGTRREVFKRDVEFPTTSRLSLPVKQMKEVAKNSFEKNWQSIFVTYKRGNEN